MPDLSPATAEDATEEPLDGDALREKWEAAAEKYARDMQEFAKHVAAVMAEAIADVEAARLAGDGLRDVREES